MKAEYQPDELLPLSGIQHFCFCRRQWALIYIEQQWKENVLTVEGKLLHKRVDDPFFSEVRNGVIISRSVPVASYRLGWQPCRVAPRAGAWIEICYPAMSILI
ncbi:MAG: Dna2/Cas4 domain-containing protein, partial [Anaerolineaceae bacterium]|nr:Dna2/Cas4 domain-containing protein [Anaerolineaceae bacterium]